MVSQPTHTVSLFTRGVMDLMPSVVRRSAVLNKGTVSSTAACLPFSTAICVFANGKFQLFVSSRLLTVGLGAAASNATTVYVPGSSWSVTSCQMSFAPSSAPPPSLEVGVGIVQASATFRAVSLVPANTITRACPANASSLLASPCVVTRMVPQLSNVAANAFVSALNVAVAFAAPLAPLRVISSVRFSGTPSLCASASDSTSMPFCVTQSPLMVSSSFKVPQGISVPPWNSLNDSLFQSRLSARTGLPCESVLPVS